MARQTIVVSVLADTSKFKRSMSNLGKETGLSGLATGAKKVGKFALGAAAAVGGIGVAVAGMAIKGGIERALNIEDAQAKLKALGHSTKGVEKIMDNALAAVKGTSFGLGEAATVAATAVAAGIKPGKELERTLKLTADAAAISGIEMGEMGSILNKVWTKGKVSTRELNQIADRGIPIWTSLAEHYGVNAEELQKMVSSGKVNAEEFADVLQGTVGPAAQDMGNTTRGSIKNMRAALDRLGETAVKSLMPLFKKAVQGITAALDSIGPIIEDVGKNVGKWVSEVLVPALEQAAKWFGDVVIPQLQKFGKWFIDEGVPAIKDFITNALNVLVPVLKAAWEMVKKAAEWLGKLLVFVKDNKDWLSALAVTVGTLVVAWKTYVKVMAIWKAATAAAKAAQIAFNAVMAVNPIVLITAAVAALVAGLVWFFTQTETGKKIWEAFTKALTTAWEWIVDAFQAGVEAVVGFMQGLWEFIQKVWSFTPIGIITQNWDKIVAFFQDIPGSIKKIFNKALTWLKTSGKDIIRGLWDGLKNYWKTLWTWFKTIPTIVKGLFSSALTWLVNAGKRIFRGLWDGLKNYWTTVWGWFKTIPGKIKDMFINAVTWLFNAGKRILRGLRDGLVQYWVTVYNWITTVKDKVLKGIGNAAKWLYEKGKDILRGLWDGIIAMKDWLMGKVREVADMIMAPFNAVMEIFSPSRVFWRAGRYLMQGLGIGIRQNADVPANAVKNVAKSIKDMDFSTTYTAHANPVLPIAGAGSAAQAPVVINIHLEALNATPETGRMIAQSLQDYIRAGGVVTI